MVCYSTISTVACDWSDMRWYGVVVTEVLSQLLSTHSYVMRKSHLYVAVYEEQMTVYIRQCSNEILCM